MRVTSANPQRYLNRFGAQFSLPTNAGSPITKVHYNVVNAAGEVVKPLETVSATNPTEIAEIAGPAKAGDYRLRLWLEDAVGHVGAVSTAPVPRDTTPPAAPQGVSVTPPSTPRTSEGFDLRWHNIVDAGSPIEAVHYRVLNDNGSEIVATKTIAGTNPEKIANLDTPRERGNASLQLWLSDAEGNVGAPVKAPLSYECVRSDATDGLALSAGLGKGETSSLVVRQDEGATLKGRLHGRGGTVAHAPLCVFSRVITDQRPEFLGIAMTGHDGSYQFALGAGPSRELAVIYRPDQRELSARGNAENASPPRPSGCVARSSGTRASRSSTTLFPDRKMTRSSSYCRSRAAKAGEPSADIGHARRGAS